MKTSASQVAFHRRSDVSVYKRNRRTIGFLLVLGLGASTLSWGAGERSQALKKLVGSLEPVPSVAASRNPAEISNNEPSVTLLGDGSVRHLRAPAGYQFHIPSGDPVAAAKQFLREHGEAFHITGTGVEYEPIKQRTDGDRQYLRLRQTSGGIPVFAGQVVVQIGRGGGIEYVGNYLERDSQALTALDRITPSVLPSEARRLVEVHFAEDAGHEPLQISSPQLTWFAPSLLGLAGRPGLAWQLSVQAQSPGSIAHRAFLDAHSGQLLARLPLGCEAQVRTVFDADNQIAWPPDFPSPPPLPRRIEAGPASSVSDVNQAYDGIGDTYAFFRDKHGRRGIGGSDEPIFAAVRVCVGGRGCPWGNASWSGLPDPPLTAVRGFAIHEGIMAFGQGFATDDVVAHEFTHGVTQFESGLIYFNASGAINEAFSDIWGEYVDLSNGRGNDSPNVRWDHGEDLPNGKNRNMKDPPEKGHPDRLGSDRFVYPTHIATIATDYGGVHDNSGIINKLAYLLTDGDTFNGYTVTGVGIDNAARLFYEVNANLLGPTADYTDLSVALHQAAANLGWSPSDVANLHRACLGVEIVNNYVNVGNTLSSPNGCRRAGVTKGGPFPKLSQAVMALQPGDPLYIGGGNYDEQFRITKPLRLSSYGGTAVIGK